MTKKRLLLIAFFPLAFAVILGVLAMLPPRPGVTKANFDRIEIGMTMAQVEEIFGRRPANLFLILERGTTIEVEIEEILGDGKGEVVVRGKCKVARWSADDGSGVLIFFMDDCVTEKYWTASTETFLNKIRRWLHLR